MSSNGYVTADELLSLCGKRLYRDVQIKHPFEDRLLHFRLQSLTEAEWTEISSGSFDLAKGGLNREGVRLSDVRLVAASLVDGDGNRLLTGKDAAKQLTGLLTLIVEPLVRHCRDLNNLRGMEDAEKNLPAGSGSATDSPELQEIPASSA